MHITVLLRDNSLLILFTAVKPNTIIFIAGYNNTKNGLI